MGSRSKKQFLSVIALASVLSAAVAACGSSGSSGSSQSPGSGSTSGTAGTPITIGGAGPISSSLLSQPERQGAIQAAIDDINASGGINGHPLKLEYCDTKFDANQEVSCMRQLVTDKVASVIDPGLITDQTGRGYQFTAQAKIPVIGGQGLTPAEFTTPGIYPIGSGIPGWSYGQVASVIKAGAKKIALFGTNEAGSLFILSFAQSALASAGVKPVRYVKVDPNADPTFAQGAAEAIAGGVDAVVFDSNPQYVPKAIAALRNAGFKGLISTITAIMDPASLKALGTMANGVLLTAQLAFPSDTANPGVAKFLADMKRYAPGDEVNETAESAWAGTMLFAAVAKTLRGDVTGQAVWDGFANVSTPIDTSIAGPYLVKGAVSPLKAFPQIYNATIVQGVVKKGVVVSDGGFVDPFSTLAALKG
jgi:branched-chain amino acid transport system substrate-binding protein